MPELPLGSALLSLVPEEEKGQGASLLLPPDLGIPHVPQPAWLQEDAWTGGCTCRVPGDGCSGGCSGAPRGRARPGTGWHGGDAGAGWGPGGNAGGRAGGRAGSGMCSVTVQLLKSADLGRQSLLYLKEIGHGWFGKVSGRSPSDAPVGCWWRGPGCARAWGEDGAHGEDGGDEPVPRPRCSWGR